MPKLETLTLPKDAANGKVLTSDASGNGTWQTAAAGGAVASSPEAGVWNTSAKINTTAATFTKMGLNQAYGTNNTSGLVLNADGSITVVNAGWYEIEGLATVEPNTTQATLRIVYSEDGNFPAASASLTEFSLPNTVSTNWNSLQPKILAYCRANSKLGLYGWTTTAVGMYPTLMVSRQGGPKGDKGATGLAMQASYAQYTLAATVLAGAWTNTTPTLNASDGDATNFSISGADIVVRDAGVYDVALHMRGPTGAARVLASLALNGVGLVQPDATGQAGANTSTSVTHTVKVPAGGKLNAQVYSTTAGAFTAGLMTITRVGGPKGDPGSGLVNATYALYSVPCTVVANTWTVATPSLTTTDGDATNFSIVGNEVVVRDAGVYHITAQGRAPNNSTRALVNLFVNDAQPVGQADEAGATGVTPMAQLSVPLKIPAGGRVRVEFYSQTAGAFIDCRLAISRQGGPTGPKGDKGDPGGTMGAAAYNGASNAYVTLPNQTWKSVPLGPAYTIDPAGSYIDNADGSVSVKEAGWYICSAQGDCNSPTATQLFIGFTVNTKDADAAYGSEAYGAYARPTTTNSLYLTPSDKLYVNLNCYTGWTAAMQFRILRLTISRAGGPKGDPGTASDSPYWRPYGWCDTVALTANVWKTLPLKSGANPGTIDPVGAFVENADGSITVRDAGVYTIQASATFAGAGNMTLSIGATPDAQNYWDHNNKIAGAANSIVSVGTTIRLAAGGKVYVTALDTVAGNAACYYASIVRETGAKGDKGDPGGTMEAAWLRCTANVPSGWAVNTFKTPTFTKQDSEGDAAAFTVGAQAITVRDAGIYLISGTTMAAAFSSRMYSQLGIDGPVVETVDSGVHTGTAGVAPAVTHAYTARLRAGAVVTFQWYSDGNATPVSNFMITRQGGTKGDPGLGIYEQAAEPPTSAPLGTLWVKTDDYMPIIDKPLTWDDIGT